MIDASSFARALALPLRAVPAVLLVLFAGLIGIIALMCSVDRRADGMELARIWTAAACAIAIGQKPSWPRRASRAQNTTKPPK
ncbi:hypothetical protein ACIRRH_29150 [Kitasatospora sp. NPDC101235]|uniref:hypothetical protein n=1 Tax=Kitasatospora sp. NPDC101235 TaxID=3364101 RepID=UPI00381416BB